MKRFQLPLLLALVAGVAVVATVLVVDARKKPDTRPLAVIQPTDSPSPAASPSPAESPAPPPPSPAPEPSDAHEQAPGLPSCYKNIGKDAPRTDVRDTLVVAAHKQYWTTTKGITVPVALMKALAWQKSRWQSSIVACDGSIGVMQVSPKTAGWLNDRFTVAYDVHTLKGNAALGAEYLEWLIKHYGETTYQSSAHPFDVLHNKGMLDLVIAAYSAGPDRVDAAKGAAAVPNPEFVAQVKDFMTTCTCLGV